LTDYARSLAKPQVSGEEFEIGERRLGAIAFCDVARACHSMRFA
jgi:hypothetical protein